jgi:hypothetical protein
MKRKNTEKFPLRNTAKTPLCFSLAPQVVDRDSSLLGMFGWQTSNLKKRNNSGGVWSVSGSEPDCGGGAPETEVPRAHLRVHPAALPGQQDQQPGLQPQAPLLCHRLYRESKTLKGGCLRILTLGF